MARFATYPAENDSHGVIWFSCYENGIYADDEPEPDNPCRAEWDTDHYYNMAWSRTHGESVESECPECGRTASKYLPSQEEMRGDY